MEGIEDLTLDVDADDYAEAAASDTPTVARTYQSEEQFQAIRAAYTAKHETSNSYNELLEQVPALTEARPAIHDKIKLDKRQQLLLGYAAGQLYFDKRYAELLSLCERLQSRCQLDARLAASVGRWVMKCRAKMG